MDNNLRNKSIFEKFEISRFYKEDLLELEFLTRALGTASESIYTISPLNIKSERLRALNIRSDYPFEIEVNGYKMYVPEPAIYLIQKILANPERVPRAKREKDMIAVNEILIHIKQSKYHFQKLKEIYFKLTKKQIKIVKEVISRYPLLLELQEIIEGLEELRENEGASQEKTS